MTPAEAQCQRNASSRMIGSGIPMIQSNAPFPKDMFSLLFAAGRTVGKDAKFRMFLLGDSFSFAWNESRLTRESSPQAFKFTAPGLLLTQQRAVVAFDGRVAFAHQE